MPYLLESPYQALLRTHEETGADKNILLKRRIKWNGRVLHRCVI